MTNLIKKIQNSIFRNVLFEKNAKIVLAVSGGPDSRCMLDVFVKLQNKYPLKLVVAHVNYALRGKDSDNDEQFVRVLAEKHALPFFVVHPKIRTRENLEEQLRNLRYAFFEKVRMESRSDFIAVAHNSDDQAETVLMHLLRSAGLKGLSGMKMKSGKIIRPLLEISRKEILNYLKENSLRYRVDKTNHESVFLRNKIRNKLIPYIERNFNPQIKKSLFDCAKSCSEDCIVIDGITEIAWKNNQELSVQKLLKLPVAIQRRVLQKAIVKKNSKVGFGSLSKSDEMLRVIRSTKGKNQVIKYQGLKMRRIGDKITLEQV